MVAFISLKIEKGGGGGLVVVAAAAVVVVITTITVYKVLHAVSYPAAPSRTSYPLWLIPHHSSVPC